jgi:8-oxo-dGTP diphosphatase
MVIGRGAGVILMDDRRRVLLQHRDNRNKWNQNVWSEFGGQIEKGETPEKAVRRELKEEIGVELTNLRFFKKYEIKKEKGIYEAFFYIAHLNTAINTLKSKQKEGKDVGLFTFQEAQNLNMAYYTRRALLDFFG